MWLIAIKYPLNARDWERGLYWLIKYRRPVEIDLDKITAPVLVIHCTQDEIVPYKEGGPPPLHAEKLHAKTAGKLRPPAA